MKLSNSKHGANFSYSSVSKSRDRARIKTQVKTKTFSDLRILSGALKGTKLISPRDSRTHPMGSREKLALFNLLQSYLEGAKVADFYAGSGALGLEALSRGAKTVEFIDASPAACVAITENIRAVALQASRSEDLELQDRLDRVKNTCCPKKVTDYVRSYNSSGLFDLIIADPPYDNFQLSEVHQISQLLKPGGILALSYPAKLVAPDFPDLILLKDRHYAAAGIAIYRKMTD